MDIEKLLKPDTYNIPRDCEKCGGVMVFKGLGEYQCEDCGELAYDDYGKVRNYIEAHKGATAAQIEDAIGVSQRSIRRLLKEGRLEVAEGSRAFLQCELCGKSIRSGRYCSDCEVKMHRRLEEKQRASHNKDVHGVSMGAKGDEGHRRFMRGE